MSLTLHIHWTQRKIVGQKMALTAGNWETDAGIGCYEFLSSPVHLDNATVFQTAYSKLSKPGPTYSLHCSSLFWFNQFYSWDPKR